MSYFIKDITKNTTYGPYASKVDLLLEYRRLTAHSWRDMTIDFSDLNVTGKDTVVKRVRDGYAYSPAIGLYPKYVEQRVVRPYQVIDDENRSVNIAQWTDDIKEANAILAGHRPCSYTSDTTLPRYRFDPISQGRKRHYHRQSHPSMWKATMSDKYNDDMERAEVEEALVELDMCPVRDRSHARTSPLSRYDADDIVEDRFWARFHNKSWKRNHKSRKQWCKHKRGMGRDTMVHSEWSANVDMRYNMEEDYSISTLNGCPLSWDVA